MGRRRDWCRVGRGQRSNFGPMKRAELAADEQMAILADRYSQRAEAYDGLWSPIIRPVGERLIARLPLSARTTHVIDIGTGAGALLTAIQWAAPSAVIVGIDRSEGMALHANRFDVAIVAFV